MSSNTNNILNSVRTVFKDFLSTEIPQKISNVIWGLFRGVQAVMEHLEWKIDLMIRERNMLTATHQSSLRTLAAENGFEPTLMIPSKGTLQISVNYSAYNKYGYPLFLPPYSVFTCETNGLKYYYDSDKALTLNNNNYVISVIQGEVVNVSFTGTGESIQRIYLSEYNISNKSIRVSVDGIEYMEVCSFFDNMGLNNNRQFLYKFSRDVQTPIILYVKGVSLNDTITVTYRTSYGELGNISQKSSFKTEDIINQYGENISLSSEDLTIYSQYGFNYGSQGDDENSLRSAIGYNHGNHILYDNTSYKNFIGRFSTLLLQKVTVDETYRQINNIYVCKKLVLSGGTTNNQISTLYKQVINNSSYIITDSEKIELNNLISEYEYCLSSHNIYDVEVKKYAIQLGFETYYDYNNHRLTVENLIYTEFSKFFYNKSHKVNIDSIISDYMDEYNIKIEFIVFHESQDVSEHVCSNNTDIVHQDYLPILTSGFYIQTSDGTQYKIDSPITSVIIQ